MRNRNFSSYDFRLAFNRLALMFRAHDIFSLFLNPRSFWDVGHGKRKEQIRKMGKKKKTAVKLERRR